MKILHIHAHYPEGIAAHRSRTLAENLSGEHWLATSQEISAESALPFRLVREFPRLSGLPTLGRLQRLAKAMAGFDLVFTYEYDAMNAVMARMAFSRAFDLPLLVHHELEESSPSLKRDWFRRIALEKAARLVVADEAGERRALGDWQQPIDRVNVIAHGIELAPWRKPPKPDFLPNILKRPGEKWIGAHCRFTSEEKLDVILRAFAPLTENWQLVLFGGGPERQSVRKLAETLEIGHRVHTPGAGTSDGRESGLFDIAVMLPGQSELVTRQLHAMASGKSVVACAEGKTAGMLPAASREFLVDFSDLEELSIAFATLASDEKLRESLGQANLEQARKKHSIDDMIAAYRRLIALFTTR